MSGFTEIARGYYLEALLIDGDRIWYTDVTLGGVRLVGSDTVLLPERTMIGGLLQNADGHLLVAGGDGVVWVDPETGVSCTLVSGLGGINEMRGDGAGGMVFGTIDLAAILAGERPGPSAIWHLSRDRTLTQIKDGLTFANGLAVSPDGTRLYFNESFSGIRCYAFDGATPLGDPLWALAKYDCDGMTLDSEGHVWISGFGSDHLVRLDPDGKETARLPLPGAACTNVRFTGPDWQDMIVATVTPEGAQALADGTPITRRDSALWRCPSPVKGAPLLGPDFARSAS